MDWTNKKTFTHLKLVQIGDEVESYGLTLNEERRRILLGNQAVHHEPMGRVCYFFQ